MQLIKYYHKGRYMGFEKMNPANSLQYINWIRSGNELKIGTKLINNKDYLKKYIQELSACN